MRPTEVELRAYARKVATDVGLDPDTFERQIDVESGFDPNAKSPAGAIGVAQIVPRWHPGVDPWDPFASLDYAAGLMRNYLSEYRGSYTLALIRYNGGGGAVAAWQRGEGYEESRRYVKAVLG